MRTLEREWVEALDKFMSAYSVAAESAMGVPGEVYAIAPLAAQFLWRYRAEFPPTKITEILAMEAERLAHSTSMREGGPK